VPRSTFIAIGVGQGDAFFFKKGGLTALVDGGRSSQGFPTQFQRTTRRTSIDVLICTHNDADHAAGILGFLRSGLTSREVWLPGSWTSRLDDLLRQPGQFTNELIRNISERTSNRESHLNLESLGDEITRAEIDEVPSEDEPISSEWLSEALELASDRGDGDEQWPYLHDVLFYDWPYLDYPLRRLERPDAFQLFLQAISAASMIRNIALAAYHSGSLIRWFEYSPHARGGIPNFLLPVNASEILRIRKRAPKRQRVLDYLALTTSNQQSLVFMSPKTENEPAVLFTADSPLTSPTTISWSDGMIITAPHHGSEANAHAYKRFYNETKGAIAASWVRSDGKYASRPGPSYLNAHGKRFCTLCRGSNPPKQNVRFVVSGSGWKDHATRQCSCV
jgi:phosphoribosyl 1,2-cyclic phosphodiesterase